MGRLTGKVAIVTGGGGGIGGATARALARAGAAVRWSTSTRRRPPGWSLASRTAWGRRRSVQADLSDEAQVEAAIIGRHLEPSAASTSCTTTPR